MFEPINFQNLNEADVREEILAPLIRRLGYLSGTKHNVIREQSLRYPRQFLGRKNAKRDPILRGIADYILEAESTIRWVLEAKAPDVEIDIDALEQAYTYANHPEIRAVYFVLCNGKNLFIFQTNLGPDANPLLSLSYDELEEQYQRISNVLSPSSILRDHPKSEPDIGIPIGEGLRSVVRITNGTISYHGSSIKITALSELQTGISYGAVERDENNQLVAFLETVAPTRSIQNMNQRLGLTSIEMICPDSYVSSDPSNPTVFRSDETIILPAGERLFNIDLWQEVQLPMNMVCLVQTEASGHLENNRFFGRFLSSMHFQNTNQQIDLHGTFEIFVA